MISRDRNNPKKAVVQVKAKDGKINAEEYEPFVSKGYLVYLYDGGIDKNKDASQGYIYISKNMIEDFYYEYKDILPESITKWEKLFK